MEWLDCSKTMPEVPAMYWITDGDNLALARWSIKDMWWAFLYHDSVFKPSFMMKVKLPHPPSTTRIEGQS